MIIPIGPAWHFNKDSVGLFPHLRTSKFGIARIQEHELSLRLWKVSEYEWRRRLARVGDLHYFLLTRTVLMAFAQRIGFQGTRPREPRGRLSRNHERVWSNRHNA